MNLLFLNLEKAWRGGENQIYLLAKGLKQKGFSVSIAYPKKNKEAIKRFQEVATVLALPSTHVFDVRNILLLKKFCIQKQITIIDANSSKAQTFAILLKKTLPHIKLVVHRRVVSPIKNNIFTRQKYLSDKVDSYVAISQAIGDTLIAYGVDKKKVRVIPSAVIKPKVQVAKVEAKKQLAKTMNVGDSCIFLGVAAALSPEKGLEDLFYFASELKHLKISFRMFIAGEGKERESLEKEIHKLGLESQVYLLGFVQDVDGFLRALDIMILPSRSEGLGTILLQAVYAETAILATQVGGIPEIIIDNKTGRLYKAENTKDGLSKLLLLIESLESRQKLIKNAKVHVQEKFSLEKMVQDNYINYLDLLS